MLAENRVREVVEVRPAVLAPVLLSVFSGRSPVDDILSSTMETFESSLTWWNEDLSRLFVHH